MKKDILKRLFCDLCVIFILILVGTYVSGVCNVKDNKKLYVESTSVNTSVESEFKKLNNVKICWGLKRRAKGDQPEVTQKYLDIIKKYNGIAIGNKEDKVIYLTFDMGYEAGYTDKVLDILKDNNVKATFFLTGHYAEANYEIVKRMIDEGHILGNHTYKHKCMANESIDEFKEDISKLQNLVYEKYNYEMKYLRPPKGEFTERGCAVIQSMGYKNVLWSFAYDDWDENRGKGNVYAKTIILDYVHSGEILLLHGNSKVNMEILDECIKQIKEKGFEFKSLDEFKE